MWVRSVWDQVILYNLMRLMADNVVILFCFVYRALFLHCSACFVCELFFSVAKHDALLVRSGLCCNAKRDFFLSSILHDKMRFTFNAKYCKLKRLFYDAKSH